MSLSRWQRNIVNESGDVIPNAEIEVFNAGASGKPTLYSDQGGTSSITNPFNADGNGFAAFYVTGGSYDIAVNGVTLWEDVALGDVRSRDVGLSDEQVPLSANLRSGEFDRIDAKELYENGRRVSVGNAGPYGPGPSELQSGDMVRGWFGEVGAADLITGDDLALELGVTEGTSQFSDAGWLKFAFNNRIIFVAKKTIRHSISWDHLYSRGLVYGVDGDGPAPRGTPTNQYTTVERAGHTFLCRLLTGANADPFDESDSRFFTDDMCELDIGGGSEWNELMYRIHQLKPDCPATNHRADRSGGPQDGENWASYTDSDLRIGGGAGRASWCQEQSQSTSSYRVLRGNSDVAYFHRNSASPAGSPRGWRPMLVLVQGDN